MPIDCGRIEHARQSNDDIYKTDDSYSKLTEIMSEVLEKHVPLKTKTIRGNQAPFMNKRLSKAIMNKSRIRNKYLQ